MDLNCAFFPGSLPAIEALETDLRNKGIAAPAISCLPCISLGDGRADVASFMEMVATMSCASRKFHFFPISAVTGLLRRKRLIPAIGEGMCAGRYALTRAARVVRQSELEFCWRWDRAKH